MRLDAGKWRVRIPTLDPNRQPFHTVRHDGPAEIRGGVLYLLEGGEAPLYKEKVSRAFGPGGWLSVESQTER